MKKFLSVLLALAVAFTFTFGSTMSAFADEPFAGYTKAEASDIIAQAVAAAESDLKAYEVNYDSNYHNQVAYEETLDDITVYEISTANLAKGITDEGALYDDLLTGLKDTGNTTIGVALTGNKTADIALVKGHILATVVNPEAEYLGVAAKASWDDYKAFLTKLVDGIDLSAYTDTTGVTYTVGTDSYDTSAKAAAAQIAAVKKIISEATFANVGSYTSLYNDIVGSYVGVYEVKNSAGTIVTAVKYILDGTDSTGKTLATTTTEANDKTTLEAAQLAAKAALKSAVVTYRTGPNYKVDYDASIAAYEEAMTYLIENYGKADLEALVKAGFSITVNTPKNNAGNYEINGVDYVARCEAAAEFVKAEAKWKSQAAELGIYYDETEAAKVLKEGLIDIYRTGYTQESYEGAYLTASYKAACKIDLSEVKAETESGIYGKVYTLASDTDLVATGKYYYEAEWKTILAAVDTFNAAVDAAEDYDALFKAYAALASSIGKVVEAGTVDDNVDDYSVANTTDPIAKYFELVKTNSEKTNIYITWDGEVYDSAIIPAHVYAWMIEQGARDKASAKALYSDACKVIDAYKTIADLKAAADAVVAQIAALPQKASDVALTDKDAIVAAAKAYAAVAREAKKYVTNVSILNNDVAALNKLDAAAINAQIAALPADAKVTAADKEAIQAALDAVEAYGELVANNIYTRDWVNVANAKPALETKLEKVQDAELDAIENAFDTLYVKYVAGTLTAEDAAAVKSLQDAIAAYISNYPADANSDLNEGEIEFYLAKIAAIVGAEVEDAAWTTTDVKASLFDSSRKLTIWRTSKTSIRVTSVGSVADIKDHGYTVKYKFYKKAPGSSTYKLVKTTTSNKYTYTNLKKGTNKFQVKVCVYDADGKLVASKWTYYRAAKIK